MAKADISAKVGLEGEKELSSNLKNINASLKTLSSEAKMVASSFDAETTAEEKAAKQAAVLSKQIEAQKKKLDLLEEGLSKSTDRYGEADVKTQKWQQSIYDTQTELNKLEQELRKNEAAMSAVSDETDTAEGHVSILQQALAASNGEVGEMSGELSILEKALLDAGDASDDLETHMGGMDSNVDDLTRATGEATDAMQDAENQTLTWGDVLSANVVADVVKTSLGAFIKLCERAAGALKDCAIAGDAYADDILTMEKVTGLSTDTLQEYSYMTELVDVSLETITGSLTKVTSSMKQADKSNADLNNTAQKLGVSLLKENGELKDQEVILGEISEALITSGRASEVFDDLGVKTTDSKGNLRDLADVIDDVNEELQSSGNAAQAYNKLHVAIRDSNGDLRKNEDVFNDLLTALGKVENETEREQLAMTLLGKSAKNLNPLIAEGADGLEALRKEAKDTGYVLSGPALKSLSKAQDGMDRLSKAVEGTKNRFAIGMAPAVETVANALSQKLADPKINKAINGLSNLLGSLLTGAMKLAEIATGGLIDELGKLGYEIPEMSDDLRALIDHTDELNESAETLHSTYNDDANAILDEKKRVEDLWHELQTLTDETGYVTEANRDRASLLLGDLNEALGTEYELNGNIIEQYGEMKTGIQELIEQKTAMALLDAGQAQYGEAQLNLNTNRQDIARYTAELQKANEDLINEERQWKNNLKFRDESILDPEAWKRYNQAVEQHKQNYNALLGEIDDLTSNLDKAQELDKKYVATIATYGEAMEASAAGNNKAVIEIMSAGIDAAVDYRKRRGEVTQQDIEQVKKDIETQKTLIKNYQDNLNQGLKGYDSEGLYELIGELGNLNAILDATGRGAQTWEEVFSAEFRYAKDNTVSASQQMATEVEQSASDTDNAMRQIGIAAESMETDVTSATGGAAGAAALFATQANESGDRAGVAFEGARTHMSETMEGIKSDISGQVDPFYWQAYELGKNSALGASKGLSDFADSVVTGMKNMIRNACTAARQEAQINSPSKVTMKIGQGLGEGVVVGMDKEGDAIKAASQRMADAAMSGSYDNGWTTSGAYEGGGYGSNSYSTSIGGITLYVNGSGVANVDQLADKVAVKLTQQIRRAQRAR